MHSNTSPYKAGACLLDKLFILGPVALKRRKYQILFYPKATKGVIMIEWSVVSNTFQ